MPEHSVGRRKPAAEFFHKRIGAFHPPEVIEVLTREGDVRDPGPAHF